MSAVLESIIAGWWRWILPLTAQVALLAVVLGLLERSLSPRVPSGVRAAFVWAVWLRLFLPPQLTSPLALSQFVGTAVWNPTAAEAAGATWGQACFALWLVGFVLASAWTARTLLRERAMWLPRAVRPASSVLALADAVASRLRLVSTPRVLLLAGASGPAAVGVLRPSVVLPAEWAASASTNELRNVLLHEFAHIARRDGIAAFAWTLARLVFWFHPLVHWTAARAATLREIGADELAAREGGAPGEYRRTLLRHARPLALSTGTGFSGFIPTGAQILARLEALERPARCSAAVARAAAVGTFALLALCCVPHRAAPSTAALEELQGCLRKRYAVLAALAQTSPRAPTTPPTPSQENRP